MRFLKIFITAVLFLGASIVIKAQGLETCKPNKYYKHLNNPGLLLGFHYPGYRSEIGISKVLFYRDKKVFASIEKVRTKPPLLIETALSTEIDLKPKSFYAPQITAWTSVFSFVKFTKTGPLYHSVGHIMAGTGLQMYTGSGNRNFNFRPEIGFYHPFSVASFLGKKWKLFPRLMYGYNFSDLAIDNYAIGKHQITFKMTIYWKNVGGR